MPIAVRVVSVERSLFEGEADFVLARGADGELGILPRHAPLLTSLKPGELLIRSGDEEQRLFVGGGFLEVLPDRVTVLADVAERAEEINPEHAEAARREAQERLATGELTPAEKAEMEAVLAVAEARVEYLRRLRQGR